MRKTPYKIPVLEIQDCLMELEDHPSLMFIRRKLKRAIADNIDNWGCWTEKKYQINGHHYIIDYELENQWYPVFITKNRWLAEYIMRLLKQIDHEGTVRRYRY